MHEQGAHHLEYISKEVIPLSDDTERYLPTIPCTMMEIQRNGGVQMYDYDYETERYIPGCYFPPEPQTMMSPTIRKPQKGRRGKHRKVRRGSDLTTAARYLAGEVLLGVMLAKDRVGRVRFPKRPPKAG